MKNNVKKSFYKIVFLYLNHLIDHCPILKLSLKSQLGHWYIQSSFFRRLLFNEFGFYNCQ